MPASSSGADQKPKEFVSKVEELKPAKELDLGPTPGFGEYKVWFPKEAVAHPAKMNMKLLEYLILQYTRPGDVVLDPFAGTGSTGVLAALHGRNAVVVELEGKYITWAKDAKARVNEAPTLNPKGQIRIAKGDARELSRLLGTLTDMVLSSPPYADSANSHDRGQVYDRLATDPTSGRFGRKSHPHTAEAYSDNPKNIGNLPPGHVDEVISSPPYSDTIGQSGGDPAVAPLIRSGAFQLGITSVTARRYSKDPGNISNLKHGEVDVIVSSPPYSNSASSDSRGGVISPHMQGLISKLSGIPVKEFAHNRERFIEAWQIARSMISFSESDPGNIMNLRHGKIDSVITSPPYERSEAFQDSDFMVKIADDQDEKVRAGINKGHPKSAFRTLKYKSGGHASQGHAVSEGAEAEYLAKMEAGRVTHPDSIGKLRSKEREIDSIISSPPFERTLSRVGRGGDDLHPERRKNQHPNAWLPAAKYSDDPANIGNAGKETYLEAMLRVYSEMWKVLKPGGRAVIIVKPFSRSKRVVDLPWQTWLLLRKVGFEFEDVLKLRLRNLSFWRIIQYKKDPNQERIHHEYVLVCCKPSLNSGKAPGDSGEDAARYITGRPSALN